LPQMIDRLSTHFQSDLLEARIGSSSLVSKLPAGVASIVGRVPDKLGQLHFPLV